MWVVICHVSGIMYGPKIIWSYSLKVLLSTRLPLSSSLIIATQWTYGKRLKVICHKILISIVTVFSKIKSSQNKTKLFIIFCIMHYYHHRSLYFTKYQLKLSFLIIAILSLSTLKKSNKTNIMMHLLHLYVFERNLLPIVFAGLLI